MRLWILSDLHLEQSAWTLPQQRPDYDVLIAAGDIHRATAAVRWLAPHAVQKRVVYVTGNHEWYSPRRNFTVEKELAEAQHLARRLGVDLLHDQEAIIEDVRFLGSPLWTDFELTGNPAAAMKAARRFMNDYHLIYPRCDGDVLDPRESRGWHARSRVWLSERLQESPANVRSTVVVTHHLPHRRSIDPKYAGDPLNAAFCSDLRKLVEGSAADLWVHGHTHSSCDYQAGQCRVLCNPKGYGPSFPGGRIENPDFDPMLVVEV